MLAVDLRSIILGNVRGKWLKVARVLSDSVLPNQSFFDEDAYEAVLRRLVSDDPELPKNEDIELVRNIDNAISALLADGEIVSRGDVKKWRFSEIKLVES